MATTHTAQIETETPVVEFTIEKEFPTAVQPTNRVLEVAAMFGLGVDDERTIKLVPPTQLTLAGGTITFVTGPSGSGKSTILRLIKAALSADRVIDFADYLQPEMNDDFFDRPLVDTIGGTLTEATRILSLAGLADAFVMLRTPRELSDGQRYRLALARIIDALEGSVKKKDEAAGMPLIVLADEFGAALDRLTAALLARNMRRYVDSNPRVALVVATTHDDLLEALAPDTLIYKPLDASIEVVKRREESA